MAAVVFGRFRSKLWWDQRQGRSGQERQALTSGSFKQVTKQKYKSVAYSQPGEMEGRPRRTLPLFREKSVPGLGRGRTAWDISRMSGSAGQAPSCPGSQGGVGAGSPAPSCPGEIQLSK